MTCDTSDDRVAREAKWLTEMAKARNRQRAAFRSVNPEEAYAAWQRIAQLVEEKWGPLSGWGFALTEEELVEAKKRAAADRRRIRQQRAKTEWRRYAACGCGAGAGMPCRDWPGHGLTAWGVHYARHTAC